MKNITPVFLLLIVFFGCANKDDVTLDEIITLTSDKSNVDADGQSLITLTAVLNPNAAKNKRTVEFKSTMGVFKSNSMNTVSVSAEKISGVLTAQTTLVAPSSTGTYNVSAEVEIPELKGLYIAEKTITADSSEVASINLSSPAISVYNNFDNEIAINAQLLNSQGKGVTSGVQVKFEDFYDEGLTNSVGGLFRSSNVAKSNSSSLATVNYSPGAIPANTKVYIRALVLLSDGTETQLEDTIEIYVNQKN